MSADGFFALAGLALAVAGAGCLGFYLGSSLYYYPRWKRGFDEGYELGKRHGLESRRR